LQPSIPAFLNTNSGEVKDPNSESLIRYPTDEVRVLVFFGKNGGKVFSIVSHCGMEEVSLIYELTGIWGGQNHRPRLQRSTVGRKIPAYCCS
jgi:hypothetical protein